MLKQDKEELLEKAKEIKLELDKLQVEWCQYHSFFMQKKDLSKTDKSTIAINEVFIGVSLRNVLAVSQDRHTFFRQ